MGNIGMTEKRGVGTIEKPMKIQAIAIIIEKFGFPFKFDSIFSII